MLRLLLRGVNGYRDASDVDGRMEQDHDEGRHGRGRTYTHSLCKEGQDVRTSKRHRLEHEMAWAPIIRHAAIGERSMIDRFREDGARYEFPLPKTSKTGELDSEEEDQPYEEQL